VNWLILRHGLDHLQAWQLVDAVRFHAPGKEFVFAIVAEVRIVGILKWQHTLAVLKVLQEGPKSSVGQDYKAAMQANPEGHAVFKEYAMLGHMLVTQNLTES